MSVIYKGVDATKVAKAIPDLADEGRYGGKVRQMYDHFVLTADLASGDTILVGEPLPEGARLLDCRLSYGAMGGSCTVNVGWAASPEATPVEAANATGFFAALPVSSAGVALAHGSTYDGTAFYQKVLAAQVQVVIAENAVSSGATGKAFDIEVSYVVD